MKACTPTLSPFALRTARRGHPTPGHPEYTFLGFSVLKSFFAFPWRGPDILGGGQTSLAGARHPWRGPDTLAGANLAGAPFLLSCFVAFTYFSH